MSLLPGFDQTFYKFINFFCCLKIVRKYVKDLCALDLFYYFLLYYTLMFTIFSLFWIFWASWVTLFLTQWFLVFLICNMYITCGKISVKYRFNWISKVCHSFKNIFKFSMWFLPGLFFYLEVFFNLLKSYLDIYKYYFWLVFQIIKTVKISLYDYEFVYMSFCFCHFDVYV